MRCKVKKQALIARCLPLFMCLLIFIAEARAAPEMPPGDGDRQGSLYSEEGAPLMFNVPDDPAGLTFDFLAEGILEDTSLVFKAFALSGNYVQSISPSLGELTNGEANPVTLKMRPGFTETNIYGEALVTLEYRDSDDELLTENIIIKVMRFKPTETELNGQVLVLFEGDSSLEEPLVKRFSITANLSSIEEAPPETEDGGMSPSSWLGSLFQEGKEPEVSEEETELIEYLQSSSTVPTVEFNGNTATLIYSGNEGLISWRSFDTSTRLTIRDVSALTKGQSLTVRGFQPTIDGVMSSNKYDLVIPKEQINYVLGEKAYEFAVNELEGLLLREDEDRSTEEVIALSPFDEVVIPDGIDLRSASEGFSFPNSKELTMMASAELLSGWKSEEALVPVIVGFNNAEASRPVNFIVDLTDLSNLEDLDSLDSLELDLIPEEEDEGAQESRGEPVGAFVSGELRQSYDENLGFFNQELAEGILFAVNIPNGLITNDYVIFHFPEEISYEIWKDDEPYSYMTSTPISEKGSYRVSLSARERRPEEEEMDVVAAFESITLEELAQLQEYMDSEDFEGLGENLDLPEELPMYRGTFHFRIVEGELNDLLFFNAPAGYKISQIQYEGAEATPSGDYFAHLPADGHYLFGVSSETEGHPAFVTEFTLQTKPPIIHLFGVENGMNTNSPVSFSTENDKDSLEVILDGVTVSAYDNTVDAPGLYRIVASDPAGNLAHVSFRILYNMNFSGWFALVLLAASIAGMSGFLFYKRHHMKVR